MFRELWDNREVIIVEALKWFIGIGLTLIYIGLIGLGVNTIIDYSATLTAGDWINKSLLTVILGGTLILLAVLALIWLVAIVWFNRRWISFMQWLDFIQPEKKLSQEYAWQLKDYRISTDKDGKTESNSVYRMSGYNNNGVDENDI